MRRRAAWMAARRDGAAVPQRVQQLWILRLGHRDGQWRGTAGGRGGPRRHAAGLRIPDHGAPAIDGSQATAALYPLKELGGRRRRFFIPWRGHGVAERFATVTIFAGAATVTPLMDTSLGRIRNSRSRRCTVLDLLENKAPGTECRQAAAPCRPSRYSGCCCTRLSAGSADPHDSVLILLLRTVGRPSISTSLWTLPSSMSGQLNLPALGGDSAASRARLPTSPA